MKVLYLSKEMIDFTSLFIAFCSLQYIILGLFSEISTLLGDWIDYLFQCSIFTNNLKQNDNEHRVLEQGPQFIK